MYTQITDWTQLAPLVGQAIGRPEGRFLLTNFPCFLVEQNERGIYPWRHFSGRNLASNLNSIDVILITRPFAKQKLVGGIIADETYLDATNTYSSVLIRPLQSIIAILSRVKPKQKTGICAMSESLALSERTMNAILRAAVDTEAASAILRKQAAVDAQSLKFMPSPLTIFKRYGSSLKTKKEAYLEFSDSSWTCHVDIIDILELCPFLISKRVILLNRGYGLVKEEDFLLAIPTILEKIYNGKCTDNRLQSWVDDMLSITYMIPVDKDYPEWKYVSEIKASVDKRLRRLHQNVFVNSAPPACIGTLRAQGHQIPFRNEERWQLAYIIRNVSNLWGVPTMLIAGAFISFMRDAGMGSARIRQFEHILKSNNPNFTDKLLCINRRPIGKGVTCPYGGGASGVAACLESRKTKDATALNISNATVSRVWALTKTA